MLPRWCMEQGLVEGSLHLGFGAACFPGLSMSLGDVLITLWEVWPGSQLLQGITSEEGLSLLSLW